MNRIVINENSSIYVDGYKHIIKYEDSEIILAISKKQVAIQGMNLLIECYSKTEMLIKGVINNVSFVKE